MLFSSVLQVEKRRRGMPHVDGWEGRRRCAAGSQEGSSLDGTIQLTSMNTFFRSCNSKVSLQEEQENVFLVDK